MNKICTTIEQSKKLTEILPLDSADMCYDGYALDNNGNHPIGLHKPDGEYDTPCWSLAALLSVIKNYKLSSEHGHHTCTVETFYGRETVAWFDSPVEACYEMIIKLHELNLL